MAHQFSSEFGSVPSLKRRLTPCDRLNHIDAAQTVSSASHIREGSDSGGAAGMPDRCRSDAQGPPLDVQPNANFAAYCGTLDFEFWLRKGEEMVTWLKKNVHPLDLVYRLAEDHSIVLLNGGVSMLPTGACVSPSPISRTTAPSARLGGATSTLSTPRKRNSLAIATVGAAR